MAVVSKITLQNFRSHKDLMVDFDDNVTIITGLNGSGKTTILEGVYYLLQGKSFKGSDSDILMHGLEWWKLSGHLGEDSRTVSLDVSLSQKKKKYTENNHTAYRFNTKNKYPVVLFEPEDLRLLSGSPTRRRRFLDMFISQLDINYQTALRRYERALKQRNVLLKKPFVTNDELFVWNIALSEHGSYIIKQRVGFIEQINKNLSDTYQKIANTGDSVSAHYSNTLIEHTQQKLFSELEASFNKDKAVGTTTIGPHRHDILFRFNNSPALSVASRGEIRTIILALKFLEVDIIKLLTGQDPVILLDDVFSELDQTRQKALSEITKNHQVIITSVEVPLKGKNYKNIKLS